MEIKGIKLKGAYKVRHHSTYFGVYDEKGNMVYFENKSGYWAKREYDEKGNVIYFEEGERE